MGKTVTYKLTVTPEYDLDFSQTPALYQDAHYVVCKLKVRAGSNVPGGWTLTSNDPENVTFVKEGDFIADIKALVDAGYWLDGYNGSGTTSGTAAGETTVYVFLKENATTSDRNITLSLKPTNGPCSAGREFSFTQYCPSWNGNLGTERIQDRDYPWGFNWSSDMKITYNMGKGWNAIRVSFYLNILSRRTYVTTNLAGLINDLLVTIDFNNVANLTTGTSVDDGIQNTWEIYNFDGVSEVSDLILWMESLGGTPDVILPTNPTEYAARACAMKNKYRVETSSSQSGSTIYKPVLDQSNMVWYLPAQNEASSMSGGLSGNYWTSTIVTGTGTTSYKYTAGGTTSAQDRNNVLHVRAVRRR